MLNKFINKIGIDKILHFCIGAIISFCISNVIMLQEGITNININILSFVIFGVIFASFFGVIKEIIDGKIDKYDIIATISGSLLPFIVNGIGIVFYIMSN